MLSFLKHVAALCADSDCFVKVLAKDPQSQRGDVPQRAGGDSGRHRAIRVRQSHGASLQTAGQVCVQPSLSGLLSERMCVLHVYVQSNTGDKCILRWQSELCTIGTTSTS